MIIRAVHNKTGKSILVDNEGQIQKKVKVTGDEPIRTAADNFFNKEIQIRYKEQIDSLKTVLPEDCIIKSDGGVYEIYKASDSYLKEYFIPKFSTLHGYTMTEEFKG